MPSAPKEQMSAAVMTSPLERGPWVATPPRPEFERNGRTASRQEWRRKKPPLPLTDDLVFVAIAAYEDLELENTMLSLLHAAERPDRIILGIVWQGKGKCPALAPSALAAYAALMKVDAAAAAANGDLTRPGSASHRALAPLGFEPLHHLGGRIRALELSAAEAKGPCWARYLSELLWQGEGWYSQLDSHMRLARAWDAECMREIALLEGSCAKPLLTCYGVSFDRGAPYDWAETTPPTPPLVLAASHFDEDRVLQIKGSAAKALFAQPRRTYFFSANFSFSRGARVAELAYDPLLKFLFYGEEILFAVRLFTAGWDLFTPTRAWAFHLWQKSHRPSYDAKLTPAESATLRSSHARVHALLSSNAAARPTGDDVGGDNLPSGGGGGGEEGEGGPDRHTAWPRPNGLAPACSDDVAFALGAVRSVSEYEDASGVRFGTREISDAARRGHVESHELKSDSDVADLEEKLAALATQALPPPVWEEAQQMEEEAADDDAPAAAGAAAAKDEAECGGGGAGAKAISELLEIKISRAAPSGSGGSRRAHHDPIGIHVIHDAMPPAFAHEARALLASLPQEAWDVAATKDQPLMDGAKRVPMHYRRNPRSRDPAAMASLRERVRLGLLKQLATSAHRLRPFERLLINFSRYDAGDFLDSHEDTPSGSRCYERRVAFVWHLSEGWTEKDGGLFVDEAAVPGATTHFVPTFNSLVSFAVPRMHKVTKVVKKGSPRYAVYGWIATPELSYVPTTVKLRNEIYALQHEDGSNESPRAAAILLLPERPPARAVKALHRFASLPMDEIGLGHCTGDYCRFFVAPAGAVSLRRAFEGAAAAADATAELALAVLRPDGNPNELAVLTDEASLCDAAAMAAFVHRERKAWHSPCPSLDMRNGLAMADMYFSPETKLHLFCTYAGRTPAFLAKLDTWAQALRPRVRLFLCEPGLAEKMMASFGLAPRDAPTAVGEDTQGTISGGGGGPRGTWRMCDQQAKGASAIASPRAESFDLAALLQFVGAVALTSKVDKEVVARLR